MGQDALTKICVVWNAIGLAALVQWNLSTEGTAGTQLASLIQRYICTQLYVG